MRLARVAFIMQKTKEYDGVDDNTSFLHFRKRSTLRGRWHTVRRRTRCYQ